MTYQRSEDDVETMLDWRRAGASMVGYLASPLGRPDKSALEAKCRRQNSMRTTATLRAMMRFSRMGMTRCSDTSLC
nr:hypothetical protein [uncultured organism]